MARVTTGRGVYRLGAVGPLEYTESDILLTFAMERTDGIERILTKCRITRALIAEPYDANAIIDQLKEWIGRGFEAIREASLKSIRSQRRLYELVFDRSNPGPF